MLKSFEETMLGIGALSDGGRKWVSTQDCNQVTGSTDRGAPDGSEDQMYRDLEIASTNDALTSNANDLMHGNATSDKVGSWTTGSEHLESNTNMEFSPACPMNGPVIFDDQGVAVGSNHDNGAPLELELSLSKLATLKVDSSPDTGSSIPQILHLICNSNDECSTSSKNTALQQLIDASVVNDTSMWTKYFNQILTIVLEVMDDPESSIRELALSLIAEMLKNQKDAMEDSIEIVIEKLLHVTKDTIPNVANEAEHCLTAVLSQYDPFRCLSVIVPLLVSEDEKTLVTCINCLTKLVGRLSQEELMARLPSFLPALFDAFGNQSADVRKTVVFCLVDIYIMLGKAFLPHLEGLNATQLRLVTIYANRISQARTGTPIEG